jgi:hypothetical protein
LQTIQRELKAANPEINIEILGVNEIGQDSASAVALMTGGRNLPLLQNTASQNVWSRWGVVYRDVRILDAQNRLQGVFNVTSQDLAIAANREALKAIFLAAARASDSDADKLPDVWEEKYFGGLTISPSQDSDGDGFDQMTEFVFGTDPTNSNSQPALVAGFTSTGRFTVTFRRWAGSLFDYLVNTSSTLAEWSAGSNDLIAEGEPRVLFDGTGTSEITFSLIRSKAEQPAGFIRLKAVAK